MSSGAFVIARYRFQTRNANATRMARIRVQPEVLAATFNGVANAEPPVELDTTRDFLFLVRSARSRKFGGVSARGVVIEWISPPIGYNPDSQLFLPVPSKATFTAIPIGAASVYLGSSCVVVEKIPEYQNGQPTP